jgi:hypothetical protein
MQHQLSVGDAAQLTAPPLGQQLIAAGVAAEHTSVGHEQQQQLVGAGQSSAGVGSRKRSRPEADSYVADAAVDAQSSMPEAAVGNTTASGHDMLQAPVANGPSSALHDQAGAAAAAAAADQQHHKRQRQAEEANPSGAAAVEEQNPDEAATAAGKPPDKHDRLSERGRRRSAKELRMLSAGIAGGSLEPTGPRSRRASRDGGPLPTDGSAALAELTEQQQQQQQQHEAGVNIPGALLQAFPEADGAAEDEHEDDCAP